MTPREALRLCIVASLVDLAAAREAVAAGYVDETPRIIPGVTHCESCGFHVTTPQRIVAWRDRCSTLDVHPLERP